MSKTSSPVPIVTAATMPESFTCRSHVHVPSLKERAEKAHTLATQAMGLFALAYLLDERGPCHALGDGINEAMRKFTGFGSDRLDFLEPAGHALHDCVEELYWVVNHPDQDAIASMRVPTDDDWMVFQALKKKGGST